MNGAATESTLQEMLNLQKAGDIGNDFLGGSGCGLRRDTGFPKGEYAMYIDGPWAVPTYQAGPFQRLWDGAHAQGLGRFDIDRRWRGPRHRQ